MSVPLPLAILFVIAAPLAGEEWRRFRGPNGSGVSTGAVPPTDFGRGQNMAWRTEVPFGRSSPVVTKDRVFLTASEGDKLLTVSLDRSSGRILWRRELPRRNRMDMYKHNDRRLRQSATARTFTRSSRSLVWSPMARTVGSVGVWELGPFQSFYGMG
ncbi:MAG: hypothetical protein HY820_23490 [Acidobacteria bacterium]|nr:hypothetical protein [Acidobacteriota bacterium]